MNPLAWDALYQQIVAARRAGCTCAPGSRDGTCPVHGHDVQDGAFALPMRPGSDVLEATEREALGLPSRDVCACHGLPPT